MIPMNRSGDGNAYNRFANLDNIEYRIVNYLAKSKTKYANNLWKILEYDTEDCLSLPDVSYKDRMALLYKNNGDSTQFRVFLTPFTDDGWDVQCSHLHIFVHSVVPQNHITSKVNIGIETIVHNKISNILGDAQNEDGNPSELDEDGNPVIIYKNRASTMLKSILADINGQMVAGVGMLQFNTQLHAEDVARMSLWNARKFYGFSTIVSTLLSGASVNSGCGY